MKLNIFEILNKSQEDLLKYTICKLEERGYGQKMHISESYVFAEGQIPVLLIAHLDTVHRELPDIYYDKKKRTIWSPQGIGGDDRCGVYAILKITENLKPYVLFTTDEEIGGVGAEDFCKKINVETFLKINFAIEIDRRGFNQAVFYECGNKEFKKFILEYGLKEEFGTFTDISIISPTFNIASVNLSAGYYNEHTQYEYICLDDLYHTIEITQQILKDERVNEYFDYQEIRYKNFKKYYLEDYDKIENNTDKTIEEAIEEEEDYDDYDWENYK